MSFVEPHSAMTATPDVPAAVEFHDVSKTFGNLEVLSDFSLSVASGEKLVIIGPSGSGKSTLLRIVMTLEPPTAGEVRLAGELLWSSSSLRGRRVAKVERARRRRLRSRVGMVFQQFNLFPHMTVLENAARPQQLAKGTPKEEALARAAELLTSVGLADKLASYPAELSGGQQQRAAIARALAMEPEIMLFDEVTAALDPELVGEVLRLMRRLALDSGMTMLIVTHEMQFGRDVADRVVFMDEGQIVETGPPDRVFTDPSTPRARQFLRRVLEAR